RARELPAEADRRRQGARDRRDQGGGIGKLVGPARRRQAVLILMDRKGLSERRACQIVGQHRSTQRREPCVAADDAALRARLRKFSKDRPRWGYRRAHCQLREEGWAVNRKRCACRCAGASASAWATRPCRPSVWPQSAPITCGRLTSSSTRPPTGGS